MRVLYLSLFLFAIYASPAAAQLIGDEDEELPEDGTVRGLAERCGRRNPCDTGLDCIRAPVLKRCFPINCFKEALDTIQEEEDFDLASYGLDMMTLSGVEDNSELFRALPDKDLNLFKRDSSDFQRLANTIKKNPPPMDLFTSTFESCANQAAAPPNRRLISEFGLAPYFGASWELGALGTYNADLFFGRGTSDNVTIGLLNNCFGVVLGFDAAISGLLGLGLTGTLRDVEDGCKQMFPVAAFPPFELQLGFVTPTAGILPTFLMEMTLGASASTGLPGYTACTTTTIFGSFD